jgi:membrane protein implicated in regulation of membrane protease activity
MLIIFIYGITFLFAGVSSIILNVVGVPYLHSLAFFVITFVIAYILACLFVNNLEKKDKETQSVHTPIKRDFFHSE